MFAHGLLITRRLPRHQCCIQNQKTNSWLGRGEYFLLQSLVLYLLASQKPCWPEAPHKIRDLETALNNMAACSASRRALGWQLIATVPSGYTTCSSWGLVFPMYPSASTVQAGSTRDGRVGPMWDSPRLCPELPMQLVETGSGPPHSLKLSLPNSAPFPFPFTGIKSAFWSENFSCPTLLSYPLSYVAITHPHHTINLCTPLHLSICFLEELNLQQRAMSA